MVVAIDGPAASGKSTIAKAVAKAAGLTYVNSGNFYRAITYAVFARSLDPASSQDVIRAAEEARIDLVDGKISLDGENVEAGLHTDQIDQWVARHSAIPRVREVVTDQLRKVAGSLDAIVEGRDIATVVFPDADVKVYIDASIEVRARRRFEQGVSSLTLEQLEATIAERDEIDRTKPFGSLKRAADAVFIDTSHLTIEQVCEKVVRKIRKTT